MMSGKSIKIGAAAAARGLGGLTFHGCSTRITERDAEAIGKPFVPGPVPGTGVGAVSTQR